MPDGSEALTVREVVAIDQVAAADWDACAGPSNPFVGHAFLAALEVSGSAATQSGWAPRHVVVEDGGGRVLAVAPLYLKTHSYGEYVFDWAWADAYHRAGGRYYPKLLSAVPFTPVTGPRLLVRPGAPPEAADALITGMVRLAERLGLSSLHVNFPTEAEWRLLGAHGFLLRVGEQFHWQNTGYADFEDFLGTLSARKRKAIRRERRTVAESGVRLRTLTGDAIGDEHWEAFYGFYRDTVGRKWAHGYLSRAFFRELHRTMADRVVLVMAEDDGRPVGGALHLLGDDALYGRYWGCVEDHRFLHFEACYYRAIDFAIERGLKRVEAGAQGPHKIQRGYLPCRTYSAHWIADPGFRDAVARYLDEEREAVDDQIRDLEAYSPFRREG